mmetsp:Transcript_30573/g.81364  ORF Transcript_30573/g.81364 Transcript_30573/m.81364 type:complete len:95 (+) Transcript_30573:482-766(+)
MGWDVRAVGLQHGVDVPLRGGSCVRQTYQVLVMAILASMLLCLTCEEKRPLIGKHMAFPLATRLWSSSLMLPGLAPLLRSVMCNMGGQFCLNVL